MEITKEMMDFAMLAYFTAKKKKDAHIKSIHLHNIKDGYFFVQCCFKNVEESPMIIWLLRLRKDELHYWSHVKYSVRLRPDCWQQDILAAENLTVFDFLLMEESVHD